MRRAQRTWWPAVLLLLPAPLLAAWSPPQRLSRSAAPAQLRYNWGRAIDVDGGGVVHAAWLEIASPDPPPLGTGRVLYSRSLDDGRSWSRPRPLSGAPEVFTGHPKLAAAGPHVYVAWHGLHDGSGVPRIYLRHSPAQGAAWDAPRVVSDDSGVGAAWPSVAACGEAVHVVWGDGRGGAAEIFHRGSADAGRTWRPVVRVSSDDGRSSWVPAVACRGSSVHVAWSDERHNLDAAGEPYDCGLAQDDTRCREEEYYRRSTDGGSHWQPEVRLTVDPPHEPRPSWAPSLAITGEVVHLAFFDARSGRFEVFFKRSRAGGAAGTWEPERVISPALPGATFHARPVIAARGPALHVVWFGVTPGRGAEVFHAASADGGRSFGRAAVLTARPSLGEKHPSVAVSPHGSAHVIWYVADARGVDQIVHRAWRGGG